MTERFTPPLPPLPETALPELKPDAEANAEGEADAAPAKPRLDPTRYGDWELNGKCVDF